MDCFLDSDRICLLTNDGSEAGIKLAQTLTAWGWQVILLSFPQAIVPQQLPLPSEVNSVRLADMSEEHFQQKLAAISDRYGQVGAFIHLSPINLDNTKAKAILKGVFLLAKHLKQPLNQAATRGRSWFVTVSRLDGKLGLGNQGNSEVISGGLCGLAKTLNWEWRSVFCRSLDLSPKLDAETTASSILAELYDPNVSIAEVGYGSQGRVTLVASDYPPALTTANIEPDSVFLVSGGGKGITAQCVIELSKYYRCKFILLGRSQLKSEPDWADNCTEVKELRKRAFSALSQQGMKPQPKEIERLIKDVLAAREIKHTLQQIEQLGSTAIYISADLKDERSLQSKLNPAINKLGKITGLIHGAGVLADKLIEHKTERDFELVYSTKVAGLQNLLYCVDLPQLKHLILFSSAAGFYGNVGQSDYAIANEILNKFAYQFKQQYSPCQVVTFNWGPWDSGMVTPELKKVFTQRGIELIPVAVGTQIFVRELITEHSTTAQVLVGSSLVDPPSQLDAELKSYRIGRKLNLASSPILQEHTIGGNPVLPVVFVTSWLANIAEQIYPGYHFFACHNYKVLKGIVFDDTLADEYILDLQEINKEQSLSLSATVWSRTKEGKNRYHYQSEIELLRQKPDIPKYSNFNYTQDRQINLAPYQDGTLFHQASFQGIKKVLNITKEKLTVECSLSKLDTRKLGQFAGNTLNAIAADIQFQCMLIWVRHFYDAGSLPVRCQYGEHFRDIPEETTFYVSLEVQSHSNTKLVANVISHDLEGNVYSQVSGAEVTISPQLNRLFSNTNSRVAEENHSKAIDTNLSNSFWRKHLGRPHPVAESLYGALCKQFVGNICLEDSQDFYALGQKPRLYLANHQVAIESMLFIYAVSALSSNVINAIAKIEHQQSWMSKLSQQLYAYPQIKDPKLNFYFDRQDRGSMLDLLVEIGQKIEQQGNSLLVHVAGTRSRSFRQPIEDLSGVFIDLAIQFNISIIPVKFVGGLPVKPLTAGLEFPWKYSHQDYYLGKAIHPQTLQSLGNLERKQLVLNRLNNLGTAFAQMQPHDGDSGFEREVKLWQKKSGVDEVRSVFYQALKNAIAPPQEVSTLITGIQQGNLKSDATSEGNWLKQFGAWLTSN